MNGPGKILQQARKKKRYSIDRVHQTTKIKQEFIEALENDEPSVFPAELYYKNFLKSYAQFLALDTNEIIKLYEQAKLEKQEDLFKQNNDNIENKFIEFYDTHKKTFIYIGCCFIIIILIYAINMFLIPNKQEINNNNIIISTSTTAIPVAIAKQKEQQIEQKLYIKATSDTWLKIIGDNKNLFESILSKGKTFETKVNQEFVIKIGNIDGVEVYFNDNLVDISKGASGNKVNTIKLKRN